MAAAQGPERVRRGEASGAKQAPAPGASGRTPMPTCLISTRPWRIWLGSGRPHPTRSTPLLNAPGFSAPIGG